MEKQSLEHFFLLLLLRLALLTLIIVTISDIFFTSERPATALVIDASVGAAIALSFLFFKQQKLEVSALIIGSITVAAMCYQAITADHITNTSMAVVMVIGFGFSVLLKRKLLAAVHTLVFVAMVIVFSWNVTHPADYGHTDSSSIIVVGITYLILYFVICYSSYVIKTRYDLMNAALRDKNFELVEKSNEIEAQNEELIQSQETLHSLNSRLEAMVEERTREVQLQNERLIKYAYTNAHHLRGPVARLLGLVQISKLDAGLAPDFIFDKIKLQADEIDAVVKSINRELEIS
jgi:signal transduction histidine kinase